MDGGFFRDREGSTQGLAHVSTAPSIRAADSGEALAPLQEYVDRVSRLDAFNAAIVVSMELTLELMLREGHG